VAARRAFGNVTLSAAVRTEVYALNANVVVAYVWTLEEQIDAVLVRGPSETALRMSRSSAPGRRSARSSTVSLLAGLGRT
jgi:hypothetical protein